MKKDLTSSIYTFENLREGNFLYVDKTGYLWNLIRPARAMYFLSRPRRFGKSLTLSTLKAIFQGKKELFRGLAVYDKPYDWKKYPVIHLDNGNCNAATAAELHDYLHAQIKNIAASYGLNLRGENLSTDFQFLIEDLAKDSPVVILLDEYDKPILNDIARPEAQEILNILKGFYSTIKTCAEKIRFAFVTGVTKFCHVSLFSDLNNLTDISMNADYAAMLGYTQAEFEANFKEWIAETETKQDLPHEKYLARIKLWYDGYKFHPESENVYNPVSLANFFINNGEFKNYWFSTGTPTFLFEVMKKQDFNFQKEMNSALSEDMFNSFELDRIDPLALLYQTGYVTIAGSRRKKVEYTDEFIYEYYISFPNHEVEESFNKCLLGNYTSVQEKDARQLILDLIHSVGNGDVDLFIKLLKSVFAGIPYEIHLKHEHYYQTVIYVIFDMLRFYIGAEHQTGDGRIDLMLTAGEWIYVVELKMDKSAAEAMKQIENKDYALKFQNRGKRIMAIGINFDSEHGQITDWLKEELPATASISR